MTDGQLYIIAAPSGGGKTSLIEALCQHMQNIEVSISHTTRPKRPNEQDGVNYHFVEQEAFQTLIQQDHFLEHAQVFKHFYGTSKQTVAAKLQQGIDLILEIDWQGAQQIRQSLPEVTSIFIVPPSLDELHQRLLGRGQDSSETIEHRMSLAKQEMSHMDEFDYLVINETFEQALADLTTIVRSHRLQYRRQLARHREILSKLV